MKVVNLTGFTVYIYIYIYIYIYVVFLTCEVGLRRVDYFFHAGFCCCHAVTKMSTLWNNFAMD